MIHLLSPLSQDSALGFLFGQASETRRAAASGLLMRPLKKPAQRSAEFQPHQVQWRTYAVPARKFTSFPRKYTNVPTSSGLEVSTNAPDPLTSTARANSAI
jgi:hypothetical protein